MFHPLSTDAFKTPVAPFRPGPAPMLSWIAVERLVVDATYQREIGRRGAQNVRQIAEHFDWSKFAPVIVAPIEGGRYAVVDGQHRTTAAILRNIPEVPCQVVQADRAKQAEAFAAVNGSVTKTTPQQLYHARVAAKDPDSIELERVCAAGGVRIVKRNLMHATTKVGETQAVGALRRCLELYGADTLITALQCVTQTGDGNAGCLRATIIEALCEVLSRMPAWRDAGERLLKAMDAFDYDKAWDQAMDDRKFVASNAVRDALKAIFSKHLIRKLGQPKLAAA